MTISEVALFPGAILPLFIFEPRYRKMLQESLEGERVFAVAGQRSGAGRGRPTDVAGLGLIRVSVRNRDGTANVALQGIGRIRLVETVRIRPYRICRIEMLESADGPAPQLPRLVKRLLDRVAVRMDQGLPLSPAVVRDVAGVADTESTKLITAAAAAAIQQGFRKLAQDGHPGRLADLVTCTLLTSARARQTILETLDIEDRMRKVIRYLSADIRRHKNQEPS
jgi:Lon protease-like protein